VRKLGVPVLYSVPAQRKGRSAVTARRCALLCVCQLRSSGTHCSSERPLSSKFFPAKERRCEPGMMPHALRITLRSSSIFILGLTSTQNGPPYSSSWCCAAEAQTGDNARV